MRIALKTAEANPTPATTNGAKTGGQSFLDSLLSAVDVAAQSITSSSSDQAGATANAEVQGNNSQPSASASQDGTVDQSNTTTDAAAQNTSTTLQQITTITNQNGRAAAPVSPSTVADRVDAAIFLKASKQNFRVIAGKGSEKQQNQGSLAIQDSTIGITHPGQPIIVPMTDNAQTVQNSASTVIVNASSAAVSQLVQVAGAVAANNPAGIVAGNPIGALSQSTTASDVSIASLPITVGDTANDGDSAASTDSVVHSESGQMPGTVKGSDSASESAASSSTTTETSFANAVDAQVQALNASNNAVAAASANTAKAVSSANASDAITAGSQSAANSRDLKVVSSKQDEMHEIIDLIKQALSVNAGLTQAQNQTAQANSASSDGSTTISSAPTITKTATASVVSIDSAAQRQAQAQRRVIASYAEDLAAPNASLAVSGDSQANTVSSGSQSSANNQNGAAAASDQQSAAQQNGVTQTAQQQTAQPQTPASAPEQNVMAALHAAGGSIDAVASSASAQQASSSAAFNAASVRSDSTAVSQGSSNAVNRAAAQATFLGSLPTAAANSNTASNLANQNTRTADLKSAGATSSAASSKSKSSSTSASGQADSSQSDDQSVQHSAQGSQNDASAAPAAKPVDVSVSAAQLSTIAAHSPVRDSAAQSTATNATSDSPRQAASTVHVQSDSLNADGVSGSSGINTARVLQTASQTEMRVGMRSNDFGDISIRTSVSSQQMVAQISVDHSGLGAEISSRISTLQEKLGNDHGVNAQIHINQGGASFTSGDGKGQSQQQEQRPALRSLQSVPVNAAIETERVAQRFTPSTSSSNRLDIRA